MKKLLYILIFLSSFLFADETYYLVSDPETEVITTGGRFPAVAVEVHEAWEQFVYISNAKWIWSKQELTYHERDRGSKEIFERYFYLPDCTPEIQGEIQITADDSLVLYINGRRVLADRDWPRVTKEDISRYLVPGENIIRIVAKNHRSDSYYFNPAGVIYAMLIKTKDCPRM